MSGGIDEYVMGMYQDSDGNIHTGYGTSSNSGFNGYLNDGTQITNGVDLPERKYYNLYTTTSANNTNIGDALYETSWWNGDMAIFIYSNDPFFLRGGNSIGGRDSGVFYFNYSEGMKYGSRGFRVCLAVQ